MCEQRFERLPAAYLDLLGADVDAPGALVQAQGGLLARGCGEGVVHEAPEDGALAHPVLSMEDDLVAGDTHGHLL